MPSLILFKSPAGAAARQSYPLDGDQVVIGRDAAECQVVIPNSAVSRRHAKITRAAGRYYLEDLESRNHTFLNNNKVAAPAALKNEDRIKICDFQFLFRDDPDSDPDVWEADDQDSDSTLQGAVDRGAAQDFLAVQPSEQLRLLLDVSTSLSRTLELEPLLPQVADALFGVFRQADRCLVILLDDAGRMIPRVVKTRRPGMDEARFSRTIVRNCLDAMKSFLSQDATKEPWPGGVGTHSVVDMQLRSVMCAPLATADGKKLGALQLDTHDVRKQFREDDLKLLTIVANLVSVAVDKAQTHAALVAKQKALKEVEVARTVQTGFLPKTYPALPGYEFYAFYSPAQTVGGDYYDFIPLAGGRVAVVLGDVAGKGVAAALLMAKLSAEVRYALLTEPDPAKAVGLLNDQLIRGGIGDRFVTLAALVVDPAAHLVTVVNAGHINPARVRGGVVEEVVSNKESGLPLGLVPGFPYEAKTVPLDLGDALLVYTDGVTDAESPADFRFQPDGVRRALRADDAVAGADLRPYRVGERVIKAVQAHAGGRPQSDDIALVCFGRADGPPTGSGLHPHLVEPPSGPYPAVR